MDVDRDNFEEFLGTLDQCLPRAAFVSMDLEFTGIQGPPNSKVAGADMPEVAYAKCRRVVVKPFNIVQVGICTFEETSEGKFVCRPFNIYLFPRPFSERDADGKLVASDDHFLGLSSSTAEFLSGHGMDFNRWIGKGVGYVDAATEQALLKTLPADHSAPNATEKFQGNGRGKPEATRQSDIDFISETMRKVDEFVSRGDEELKLPNSNAFLALILRNQIDEKYPQLVVEKRTVGGSNWPQRWVLNLTDEGRKQRAEATRKRIMSHLGFRQAWNLLRKHSRPTVFHNGLYDLLFLCQALEAPLPTSLGSFKSLMHAQFPVFFDTKTLAEASELSGSLGTRTSLPELSSNLDSKLEAKLQANKDAVAGETGTTAGTPETGGADGTTGEGAAGEEGVEVSFTLAEGHGAYAPSGQGQAEAATSFHNAGYDAYQTGRVFAYFRKKLGDMKTLDFMNRVYLMWTAFQIDLANPADKLIFNGIGRWLYEIDTVTLGPREIAALLQPVLEDGKRKVSIRQSSERTSALIVLHGCEDTAEGAEGRAALEERLDALLGASVAQGKLKVRTLEERLRMVTVEAAPARVEGDTPAAKRARQE